MAKSSRECREELVMRVQVALNLPTKKQAYEVVNAIVSCLEDMLVEHLDEDGYYLKLNGLGQFIVPHRPPIRRRMW
jgi:nucleoid DNA-binding protein